MRVWIDQDLCTGDGLCLDHAPDVFVQLEDGIAYVAQDGQALNDPGGSGSLAHVDPRHQHRGVEAVADHDRVVDPLRGGERDVGT